MDNLALASPEIFLLAATCLVLVIGLFVDPYRQAVYWLSQATLVVTLLLAFGQTALALHVPVTHPSEALFGAPNGYFLGDLTPAQNFVLAEHLRINHAYELMGLGASLIDFIRADPADKDDVAAVLDSVAWLYRDWNDTSGEWHDPVPGLKASATGSRLLFLGYSGA